MNDTQRINEALGLMLGDVGRAVWLAVRVDGQQVSRVARSHNISVGKVREILDTADAELARSADSLIRIRQDEGTYKPNYNGFHQTEE